MRLTRPFHALLNAKATSFPHRISTRSFASHATKNRSARVAVAKVQELSSEHAVAVTWEDGFAAKFHKLWLRDHCTCPACLHPETKQRQIDTASIPLNPSFHKLEISDDGKVAIAWENSVVRCCLCLHVAMFSMADIASPY